jgi:hypothetical protein
MRKRSSSFQFDSEGRVAVEEMYEHALSLMRQLGALGI